MAGIPPAPVNFQADAISDISIQLTWDDGPDEIGYQIDRSLDNSTWVTIGGAIADGESFTDSGLLPDQQYYYLIRAGYVLGYSGGSTAQTRTGLVAPGGLAAVANPDGTVGLTWTDNANNETGFYVESSTNGVNFGAPTRQVPANQTACNFDNLTGGTTYFFRVRATDATADYSSYSNVASASASSVKTVPGVPLQLKAASVSDHRVDLTWVDNSDREQGYKIDVSVDNGATYTQIATLVAPVTTYSATGLAPSAQYLFRVRAFGAAGDSAPAELSVSTQPRLTATADAAVQTLVHLAWTDTPNETAYKLERSTDASTWTPVAMLPANTTNVDDIVPAQGIYYYRLQAVTVGGESQYSNITFASAGLPGAAPTLYWYPNVLTLDRFPGGDGTWDLDTPNWSIDNSLGGPIVPWINGAHAVFGGNGGTVTINSGMVSYHTSIGDGLGAYFINAYAWGPVPIEVAGIDFEANYNLSQWVVYDTGVAEATYSFVGGPQNTYNTQTLGLDPDTAVGLRLVGPATITVEQGVSVNLGAYLDGSDGLVKNGSGTLTLNNARATTDPFAWWASVPIVNSYLGPTTIADGTLIINGAGALGDTLGGTTVESGATLNINGWSLGDEAVTINGFGVNGQGALINNGSQQLNALKTLILGSDAGIGGSSRFDVRNGTLAAITGGYDLTIDMPAFGLIGGTATLGDIFVSSGDFFVERGAAIVPGVAGSGIYISPNAALKIGDYGAPTNVSKPIILDGGLLVALAGSGEVTVHSPITIVDDSTVQADTDLVLTGVLGGDQDLTKNGNGTLTVQAGTSGQFNTLSGLLSVLGGELHYGGGVGFAENGAVTGDLTVGFGVPLVKSLQENTVADSSRVTFNSQGTYWELVGDETIAGLQGFGVVTNLGNHDSVLTLGEAGVSWGDYTFAGTIRDGLYTLGVTLAPGAPGLVNRVILSGENTYSGSTVVEAATNGGLATLANGAHDALSPYSAHQVGEGGVLDLAGHNAEIGSLSGEGVVENASIGTLATLTVGGDQSDQTFTGVIRDWGPVGTGLLGVTKTGAGTWILTGEHAYTGPTTVAQGILQWDGSNDEAGVWTVMDMATLTGGGVISSQLVVEEGGTLSPGVNGSGILRAGSLTLAEGSNYNVNINGNVAGTGHDQLEVSGEVDLTGAMLSAFGTRTNQDGDVLVILNKTDTDPVTGTFLNLPEGSLVTVNGVVYTISYVYDAQTGTPGSGNDVALTDGTPAAATNTLSVTASAVLIGNEGPSFDNEILGSFTDSSGNTADAGRYIASISWGDGSMSGGTVVANTSGGFDVLGSHGYADNADYPVQITVTDVTTGATAQAGGLADIANVAPQVTSLYMNSGLASVNGPVVVSGQFTDPGTLDGHTVMVDWGDGSPSDTWDLAAGIAKLTSPPHMYAVTDTYTITVTVTDSDGASVTAQNAISVVPMVMTAVTPLAYEGRDYELTWPVQANAPAQWLINWGDGTTSTIDGKATYATHRYADGPAEHTVRAYRGSASGEAVPVTLSMADPSVAGSSPVEDTGPDSPYVVRLARTTLGIVAAGSQFNNALGYDFAIEKFDTQGNPVAYSQVTTDFGASNDLAREVFVLSDQKVLVVGQTDLYGTLDIALARYNTNGTLDTTFGANLTGKVVTNLESDEVVYGAARDSSGRIVVVGSLDEFTASGRDFFVARYLSDGTLDSTFGTGGIIKLDFSGAQDVIGAVGIDGSNRIVLVGTSTSTSSQDLKLIRYSATGSLDGMFGTGGIVTLPWVGGGLSVTGLKLDGSNRPIVLANQQQGDENTVVVMRFASNGTVDTSFGAAGKVVTDLGLVRLEAYGLETDPSGRILVTGTSQDEQRSNAGSWVARWTSNGTLDTTFGAGGRVRAVMGGSREFGYDLMVNNDGSLLVGVGSPLSLNDDLMVAPFTTQGLPWAYQVSVENVAPKLNIIGPTGVNERQLYSIQFTVDDPGADDVDSWIIDWGDGVVQTLVGPMPTANHTYEVTGLDASVGLFAVTVMATDEDDRFNVGSFVVTVVNVDPSAAQNLQAIFASDASGDIELTWDAAPRATGYDLYRGTDPYHLEFYHHVPGTSYLDPAGDLTDGTHYYYHVVTTATDVGGVPSDPSNTVTLTTALGVSQILSRLITEPVTGSQAVFLDWSDVPDASGFTIYRGTQADLGPDDAYEFVHDATAWFDTDLDRTSSYYYAVEANHDDVAGALSQAVFVLGAPASLSFELNGDDSITLTWPAVTGATGYHVYRAASIEAMNYTQPLNTTPIGQPGSLPAIAQFTDSTPNSDSFYVVRSVDGDSRLGFGVAVDTAPAGGESLSSGFFELGSGQTLNPSQSGSPLISSVGLVATSSTHNPNRKASNAVDGTGLVEGGHNNIGNAMWMSAPRPGGRSTPRHLSSQWFKIELTDVFVLDEMAVRNFNETGNVNRGVRYADVFVSTSGEGDPFSSPVDWTLVAPHQFFTKATGNNPDDTYTMVDLRDTPAAWVFIRIDSNWGHPNFVGLAEIQLFGAMNHAPVHNGMTLSSSTLQENQPPGTVIGTLTPGDTDPGDMWTYELVSGPGATDNGLFTIDGSTVKTSAGLDYELKPEYSIRVQVTDQGDKTAEQQFLITVTNVAEVPHDLFLDGGRVAHGAASNTHVGWLSAKDSDVGTTFTYSMVVSGEGSADHGLFTVDSQTGEVKTADPLNFGAIDQGTGLVKDTYSIRVRATDDTSRWIERPFAISVTPAKVDSPWGIYLSHPIVPENQPTGTAVGQLTTDITGQLFSWQLPSGVADNDRFALTGSTPAGSSTLVTYAVFNHASKSSYDLRVRATPVNAQGQPEGDAFDWPLVIQVAPQIASSQLIAQASTTLKQSKLGYSPTAVVNKAGLTVPTADPSSPVHDRATSNGWSSSSLSDEWFRIDTGDYQMLDALRIWNGNVSGENQFGVKDVDIYVSNTKAGDSKSSGSAVANNPVDNPSDWTLVTSGQLAKASGNANDGNSTLLSLDGIVGRSVAIRIKNNWGGSGRATLAEVQVFGRSLEDAQDLIIEPNLSLYFAQTGHGAVFENQPIGTSVGELRAWAPGIDPALLTFSLAKGADNGNFQIVGNQLQTKDIFNYEKKTGYTVAVTVTGPVGFKFDKSLVVDIGNATDTANASIAMFADPDLEHAVRATLGVPWGTDLTKAALASNLSSLRVNNGFIESLVGLEYATELRTLDVRNNQLTTIPANILTLSNLEELSVYGNPIADPVAVFSPWVGKQVRLDWPGMTPSNRPTPSDLAVKLNKSPVEVYEWVLNNIEYQPYSGLMKGPQATLETKAGNAWDIAGLLDATLQAGGLADAATRYVTGRVVAPRQTVGDFLGVRSLQAAYAVLDYAGLHPRLYDNTGDPMSVDPASLPPDSQVGRIGFDHTWLQVTFDGSPYLLDAAWKFKDFQHGLPDVDIMQAVPFDQGDYFSQPRQETAFEYYKVQVADWLAANYADLSVADLAFDGPIHPQVIDELPETLPYSTDANQTQFEYDQVPAAWTHQLRVLLTSADGTTTTYLDETLVVPEVSLSPILVDYTAASNGRFRPFLTVGGKRVESGSVGIDIPKELASTGISSIAATVNTSTTPATYTFTRSASTGSFITNGFQVGDTISVAGFTHPQNNGVFTIAAVSATALTLGPNRALVNEIAEGNEIIDEVSQVRLTITSLGGDGQGATGTTRIGVLGTNHQFTRASGSFVTDGFEAGDVVYASGFANAANNGRFEVTGVSAAALTVNASTMDDEAATGNELINAINGGDRTTNFARDVGNVMAVGLDAHQHSHHFLSSLRETANKAQIDYINTFYLFGLNGSKRAMTGSVLQLAAASYFDQATRADQGIADVAGAIRVSNSVSTALVTSDPTGFHVPNFDLQIPFVPNRAWIDVPDQAGRLIPIGSPTVTTGNSTIEVASVTNTFVRPANSGSFITDGFRAGNMITVSGFDNPANTGTFQVLGVSDTLLVVNSTNLMAESATGNETISGTMASTGTASLAASAADHAFTRTTGSFVADGFQIGDKISVTGFTNSANNGTFKVVNVIANTLTVTTLTGGTPTLIAETATGDEAINATATTNATSIAVVPLAQYTRGSGSFVADGFEPGGFVDAAGFNQDANNGTYRIVAVTPTTLTVNSTGLACESASGDEVLGIYGFVPINNLAGQTRAALEAGVWEELTNIESMSTVKSFQLARQNHTEIVEINPSNISSIDANFQYLSQTSRDRIKDYVNNQNSKVRVPKATTPTGFWTGAGYIVEYDGRDPLGRDGLVYSYAIDGYLNGSAILSDGGALTAAPRNVLIPPLDGSPHVLVGDPIDVANGNVSHTHTDFTFAGVGPSLMFQRQYDSFHTVPAGLDKWSDRGMGQGWSFTYSDTLTLEGLTTGTARITIPSPTTNQFTRSEDSGSFIAEGFKVGRSIKVTGFSNAQNNGDFKVSAVTAHTLTVTTLSGATATLVTELTTGDEAISATVTTGQINLTAAGGQDDRFSRSIGSFVGDGFRAGDRVEVSGFSNPANNGVFEVAQVADLYLIVINGGSFTNQSANATILTKATTEAKPLFAAPVQFTRGFGSFVDEGFAVGDLIDVRGFANSANQGAFHVMAVTDTALTVDSTSLVPATTTADKDMITSQRKAVWFTDSGKRIVFTQSGDDFLTPEGVYGTLSNVAVTTSSSHITVPSGPGNRFVRTSGSFVTDGFRIGDPIVVSGFSNSANNGPFKVSGVTGTSLTVTTPTGSAVSLVAEAANGNEAINVSATTGSISLTASSTNRKFTRSSGSFVTNGFKDGDVIYVTGFTNPANNGTFTITNVTATALTVDSILADGMATAQVVADHRIYSYRDKSGQMLVFNSDGRFMSAADRYGNGVEIAYISDKSTKIQTVTDLRNLDRKLTFKYNDNGHIDKITDWTNNTWDYAYSNGQLAKVATPSDSQTPKSVAEYDYYADFLRKGLLKQVTMADGATNQFTYYANRRGFQDIDALGHTVSVSHNLFRSRTEFTDQEGNITQHDYNENGNPIVTTFPDLSFQVTTWEHNLPIAASDPLGRTTTYVYDDYNHDGARDPSTFGNLTRVVQPNGLTTDYSYDLNYSQVTAVFSYDPAKVVHTTFDDPVTPEVVQVSQGVGQPVEHLMQKFYDSRGNLLRQQSEVGTVITATFNPDPLLDRGLPVTTATSSGFSTAYTYNSAGQLETRVGGLGLNQVNEYDSRGNLVVETGSNGDTSTNTYDILGRLSTQTNLVGHTGGWTYNPLGRVLSVTDFAGRITTNVYNLAGQRTQVVNADGTKVLMVYDAKGRVAAQYDELGRATRLVYDAMDRPVATARPDGTVVYQEYNGAGRVARSFDALGNTTSYTYDVMGRLASVTNALGQTSFTEYDLFGNPIEVTDSAGHTTKYQYDSLNRLIRTTQADPDGVANPLTSPVWQQVYDADGNMALTVDPLGRQTLYTFDGRHRLVRKTDPDPDDLGIGSNDPDGSSTDGPLLDPITYSIYDRAGNLASTIGPAGQVTYFEYDSMNRVTKVTQPDPDGAGTGNPVPFVVTAYNAAGNVLSTTDHLGRVTSYEYDNLNRVKKVTRPDPDGAGGNPVLFIVTSYDAAGSMVSTTDHLGRVTSYEYDSLNRVTKATQPDPDGPGGNPVPFVTTLYNAAGNVLSTTDHLGRATSYEYDSLNRLTKVTQPDPDGAGGNPPPFIVTTYDVAGNIESTTDHLNRITSYKYDTLNRLTKVTQPDPDGAGTGNPAPFVVTVYDAASNVVSTTDHLDRVTSYEYDNLNRVKKVTRPDPDGAGGNPPPVVVTAYDAAGNVVSTTDHVDRVASYEYDSLNRLTKVTQPDPDGAGGNPPPFVVTTYDAAGNVESTRDHLNRITSYKYDTLNRLTKVTQPDPDGAGGNPAPFVVTAYNSAGSMVSTTDHLGRVTSYEHDSLNRMTKITQPDPDGAGGNPALFVVTTYNSASNVISTTDHLGRTTTYVYDALDRLTKVTQPDPDGTGGNPPSFVVTVYDAASNVESTTDHLNRITSYKYDALDHLTKVTQPDPDGTGGNPPSFVVTVYDAASNVESTTDHLNRITSYKYDALDRVTKVTQPDPDGAGGNPAPFVVTAYNSAGNVVSTTDHLGRVTSYDYDSLNRVTKVTQPDPDGAGTGNSAPFIVTTYNAAGNVVSTTDHLDRVTSYEYDSLNRVKKVIQPDPDGIGTGNPAPFVITAYNSAGNVVSTTDHLSRTTSYEYDNLNRVKKVTQPDPDGAGGNPPPFVVTTYDAAGNVLSTTDHLGRVTSYEYDSLNRMTKVTQPDPDGVGGNPAPFIVTTYNSASNVVSTTDHLGRVTSYDYDSLNRLTKVTQPDPDGVGTGNPATFVITAYNSAGNVISTTDHLSRTTSYEYDNFNRQTRMTEPDPDGNGPLTSPIWQSAYDSAGNVVSTTDPLSHVTRYGYDALDRRTRVTDALGLSLGDSQHTITTAYNSAGNIVSVTDPLGRVTQYQYDNLNRQTGTTQPDPDGIGPLTSPIWQTAYNAAGNIASSTDPLGRVTTHEYDTLDRVKKVTQPDPDGAGGNPAPSVQTAYNSAGNVLTTTDHLGRVTQYQYDKLDRQTQLTEADPDGTGPLTSPIWQTTYDSAGNVVTTTDPLNHVTRYGYDALDRRTQATDALGSSLGDSQHTTTTAYDSAGNILSITDPGSTSTTYTHDTLNRIISSTRSGQPAAAYQYDSASNLTQMTDPNGRKTQYLYDARNLRTTEKWLDSGNNVIQTLAWGYDNAGQLTTAGGSGGISHTFGYDAVGRMTSSNQTSTLGTLNFNFAYDSIGNRTSTTQKLNGGSVQQTDTYVFDVLDRVSRITQTGSGLSNKRADFAYDSAGRYQTLQRFADTAGTQSRGLTTYAYDNLDRINSLQHKNAAGTQIDLLSLAYDAVGRITTRTTTSRGSLNENFTFTYDNTNQLTSANDLSVANADQSFSFDGAGNRTSANGSAYTTSGTNRLTSDSTYNYTYDSNGNLLTRTKISDGTYRQFTWDHRNRLTSVTDKTSSTGPVTQSVTYTYDCFDNLVGRSRDADGAGSAAADMTYFVWDNDQIVMTWHDPDGSGTSQTPKLSSRLLWGPGTDFALAGEFFNTSGTSVGAYWAMTDHQGTVVDVLSNTSSNNHIQGDRYDAFGVLKQTMGPSAVPDVINDMWGYTGRQFDSATGLQNNRARWYDAVTGRFISEDPIAYESGDPNFYRYVLNNPLSHTDPTGHNIFEDIIDKVLGVFGLDMENILDDWLGIDKDKTFGISHHTFFGSVLYGQVQGPINLLKADSWDEFAQAQFQTAWYGLGMEALLTSDDDFSSFGIDLGFANLSGAYDPVTGDRTITGGFFGAKVSTTMHANGDIDHAVGAGIGLGFGASVSASAMIGLDHPRQSYATVGVDLLHAANASIGVNGRGEMIGGFGVGVPGSLAKGPDVNLYGWGLDEEGIGEGGWNVSVSVADMVGRTGWGAKMNALNRDYGLGRPLLEVVDGNVMSPLFDPAGYANAVSAVNARTDAALNGFFNFESEFEGNQRVGARLNGAFGMGFIADALLGAAGGTAAAGTGSLSIALDPNTLLDMGLSMDSAYSLGASQGYLPPLVVPKQSFGSGINTGRVEPPPYIYWGFGRNDGINFFDNYDGTTSIDASMGEWTSKGYNYSHTASMAVPLPLEHIHADKKRWGDYIAASLNDAAMAENASVYRQGFVRGGGLIQGGLGLGEAGLGAGAALVSWGTSLTISLHGLDNAQAGFRTAWTGDSHSTYGGQAARWAVGQVTDNPWALGGAELLYDVLGPVALLKLPSVVVGGTRVIARSADNLLMAMDEFDLSPTMGFSPMRRNLGLNVGEAGFGSHVVPQGAFGARSTQVQLSIANAQDVLNRNNIDIHSWYNGFIGENAGHAGTHTDEFLKLLGPRLRDAETAGRGSIFNELNDLKLRVLSGEFE